MASTSTSPRSSPPERGSPPLNNHRHNGVNGNVKVSPTADPEEIALLQKLEEANRMLEADQKSLQTLTPSPQHKHKHRHCNRGVGHSRTASISSVISNTSISSNISGFNNIEEDAVTPDDLWNLWGKITSDWDNIARKKASYIKVRSSQPKPSLPDNVISCRSWYGKEFRITFVASCGSCCAIRTCPLLKKSTPST
jgi:hypothetical protein